MTVDATLMATFGQGEISNAYRLAVDPTTGDVLVADQYPSAVLRFGADGSLLDTYALPAQVIADKEFQSGIGVDGNGKIWISDSLGGDGQPHVYRLAADGTYEAGYFTDYTTMQRTNDLTVGIDGKLYVTSAVGSLRKGLRISLSGTVEETFGSGYDTGWQEVPPAGQFDKPTGIACDSQGNVYIADVERHVKLVSKFSSTGTYVTRFGGTGSGDGQFGDGSSFWYQDGMGLDVDADDRIFVADARNARVNVFDADGGSLGAFGTGTMAFPVDVACGADGFVYVMDQGDNEGPFVTKWDLGGSAPDFMIRGISVVVCGDTDC